MSWRAAWNTFSTFSSAISVEERLQVDAVGQRVDHDSLVRARHLHHAEQGIIGGLAQELGVDGDDRMLGEARASLREFGSRSLSIP